MKKIQQIIIVIVALVILGGGTFYGGMVYGKGQNSQRMGGQGTRTGGRFAMGNNFIAGQVTAKDNQSVTIKDRSGSSRIVFYSTSTDVGKFVSGNISDVIVGSNVMVNGKTNTDGSISAQSIQIRPILPQGQGPGNGGQ